MIGYCTHGRAGDRSSLSRRRRCRANSVPATTYSYIIRVSRSTYVLSVVLSWPLRRACDRLVLGSLTRLPTTGYATSLPACTLVLLLLLYFRCSSHFTSSAEAHKHTHDDVVVVFGGRLPPARRPPFTAIPVSALHGRA